MPSSPSSRTRARRFKSVNGASACGRRNGSGRSPLRPRPIPDSRPTCRLSSWRSSPSRTARARSWTRSIRTVSPTSRSCSGSAPISGSTGIPRSSKGSPRWAALRSWPRTSALPPRSSSRGSWRSGRPAFPASTTSTAATSVSRRSSRDSEPRSAASEPSASVMRPVVVGTAGHIDHGKTALVRRLTGIDTDRLKEEKERGISIDLGFAHRVLPSGRRIAIVDVPGHERFMKNMLAGATGVDLVLLVVAADEGVMPQTREHVAIVSLLHVTRGVVALTKSDLVDAETLGLVRAEVEELLAATPLRGISIVPVSSVTGEGVEALLLALDQAAGLATGREASGPARLPIDRVFPVEGIGTVVTGTLWSGTVRPGDTLTLLPSGQAVRVRQAQVHDRTVEEAHAGQRLALAIHGVSRENVKRGDWLASPGR